MINGNENRSHEEGALVFLLTFPTLYHNLILTLKSGLLLSEYDRVTGQSANCAATYRLLTKKPQRQVF